MAAARWPERCDRADADVATVDVPVILRGDH
jgi:hypothetical protein